MPSEDEKQIAGAFVMIAAGVCELVEIGSDKQKKPFAIVLELGSEEFAKLVNATVTKIIQSGSPLFVAHLSLNGDRFRLSFSTEKELR